MEKKQATTIYIETENVSEAQFMSRSFVDMEIKNRAYINALGAELVMKYLSSEGVLDSEIHNIHSISKILEKFDISDILLPNIHLDVRVVFDENQLFIPKSHSEYGISPDAYVFVKLNQDFSSVELLGYCSSKDIDKNKSNNFYYFVDKSELSSVETLTRYITQFIGKPVFDLDEEDFLRGRELSVKLTDHNISEAEIKELLNLLMASDSLRESVLEFDNFETLSYNSAPELTNLLSQRAAEIAENFAVNDSDIFEYQDTTVDEESMLEDDLDDVADSATTDELILDGEVESVDEIEQVEEVLTLDGEVESIDEIEQVEEVLTLDEEVESVDEIEQVEEVLTLDEEVESVDEIEQVEEVLTLDEEVESVDEIEQVEEVLTLDEEVESVDEIEQVEEVLTLDEEVESIEHESVQNVVEDVIEETVVDSLDDAISANFEAAATASDTAIKLASVAGDAVEDILSKNLEKQEQHLDKMDYTNMQIDGTEMPEELVSVEIPVNNIDVKKNDESLTDFGAPKDLSDLQAVESTDKIEVFEQETISMKDMDTVQTEDFVEDTTGIVDLDNISNVDSPTKPIENLQQTMQESDVEKIDLPDLNAFDINEDGTSSLDNLNVEDTSIKEEALLDMNEVVDVSTIEENFEHLAESDLYLNDEIIAKTISETFDPSFAETEEPTLDFQAVEELSEVEVEEVSMDETLTLDENEQEEIQSEIDDGISVEAVKEELAIEEISSDVALVDDVPVEDIVTEELLQDDVQLKDISEENFSTDFASDNELSITSNEDVSSLMNVENSGEVQAQNEENLLEEASLEDVSTENYMIDETSVQDIASDELAAEEFTTPDILSENLVDETVTGDVIVTEELPIEEISVETVPHNEFATEDISAIAASIEDVQIEDISSPDDTQTSEILDFADFEEFESAESFDELSAETQDVSLGEVSSAGFEPLDDSDWLTDLANNSDEQNEEQSVEEMRESLLEAAISQEQSNNSIGFDGKENSTVITDKSLRIGEIPIDINYSDKKPMMPEDSLSQIYNQNKIPGESLIQNPGRISQGNQNQSRNGLGVIGMLITLALLGAIGFGVAKFFKAPTQETPEPIVDEPVPTSSDNGVNEQNTLKVNPDNVVKMDKQTVATVKPQPATQAVAQKSVTKTKPVSTFLEVKKLTWDVPDYISYNPQFKQYFQSVGKSLKLSLNSDLLLASDQAYSNEVKVSVTYEKEGALRNAQILKSSGSTQIDKIVLQTVNQTLKAVKAPHSVGSDESTTVILKIYF